MGGLLGKNGWESGIWEPNCGPSASAIKTPPILYSIGFLRQLVTLVNVTFSLFLWKIQPIVYMKITKPFQGGGEQDNAVSCLTSAGMVTLASGTIFLHISTLVYLTSTTLCKASVMQCLGLGFKADISSKKWKLTPQTSHYDFITDKLCNSLRIQVLIDTCAMKH